MNNLTIFEIILIIYILLNWFLMIMFAISFNIGQEKLEKTITNILKENEKMTSKELEKSIKWLSNVNNFKNVSRYSKEYFEHFNKVVKALEQSQKQIKELIENE